MRCRNCGTENDDNRYICENCGSPLYDENDADLNYNDEATQTFKAVDDYDRNTRNTDETERISHSRENYQPSGGNGQRPQNSNDGDGKSVDKKSIAVIAILVVVLIAIIASIVSIAGNKNDDKDTTEESELTKVSTTVKETTERDFTTTTEKETETTTEKTTEATKVKWIINAGSSGGGTTSGGGEYENGDKVTLKAVADEGYEFDGWYSNGIKVSSDAKYTFTANENASFSALFNPVETAPPETEATADTSADIVFGE
ncbi:MAG: zinc-ribbon domain-containing protein [Eubacteriales bacterium]|nr:zinc-ribbon domain-containing protein [Eubacteriales bacterium]